MSAKKKKKGSGTFRHSDPINDMPESYYITSSLRKNFGGNHDQDYDPLLSATYGSHMAHQATEILGHTRAHSLIHGYIEHQKLITRRVPDVRDPQRTVNAAKMIKVEEVLDLEIINRPEADKYTLGKKLQLFFIGGGKEEKEESITTGWLDYYGYGDEVFQMCLARSIAASLAVLRDMNLDKPIIIRKSAPQAVGKTNRDGQPINIRDLLDVNPSFDSEAKSAIIGQNLEATIMAVEKGTDNALDFLEDQGLYDEYSDRAFGLPAE